MPEGILHGVRTKVNTPEQLYSIEDITIKEYLELTESSQYDIFIDTLDAVNCFAGKHCLVSRLSFDEIEVMKQVFTSPNINDLKDIFCLCYDLRGDMSLSADEQFYSASVFDLFRAKRFLQEFITTLIEREVKVFTGVPDDKSIAVNAAERLRPFNHQLSKIRLGEQFGFSPDDIGRWKYSRVFSIQASNKIYNDIQREKAEIK